MECEPNVVQNESDELTSKIYNHERCGGAKGDSQAIHCCSSCSWIVGSVDEVYKGIFRACLGESEIASQAAPLDLDATSTRKSPSSLVKTPCRFAHLQNSPTFV
jgi:hypothetical protein